MIPNIKRCNKLKVDKNGFVFCKSTHVCYRKICESTLYATVFHSGGRLFTFTPPYE